MDFVIAKKDFNSVVRQVLQGRAEDSGEMVELTADRSTLVAVATGLSVELSVEAASICSASIPISVIFGLKRISRTYKDDSFRLRISEGKLRFQGTVISHPAISIKKGRWQDHRHPTGCPRDGHLVAPIHLHCR